MPAARALLAALVVLAILPALAGCAAPPGADDTETEPGLVGSCPSYIGAPDSAAVTGLYDANSTKVSSTDRFSPRHEYEGYPLDRYVLRFSHADATDGRLIGTVFAGEEARLVRDFRYPMDRQSVPTIQFNGGVEQNVTMLVDLAPIDATPRPSDLRIEWSFERDADGNPATASQATYHYEATFFYRVCGQDL